MFKGNEAEREQELLEKVNQEMLMQHTQIISQWERLSGSDEELEAFRYIEKCLEEYGYDTHFQQAEALISLPQRAELFVDGLGAVECITHSMSASVQQMKGEVVYCGLGRASDFRNASVSGKIALVEGIAMPGKVKAGEDAGAIAQIHISGDQLHEMCISTVWGSPALDTAHLVPKTPSVTIRSDVGDKIKALLEPGSVVAEMSTDVDTQYRPIPCLTATLQGAIERERFVLFSGHVDSWHYGAMDNGSANAAQLEIARLLATHGSHRRGIRLAFWSGHSHGRYAGSAWYVDHHWEDLFDNCVAHVNIDSVGGKGATLLEHSYAMQEVRPLVGSIIAEITGQEFQGSRVGRAGDHSFMGVGIPAMLMDLSAQPLPKVETATSRAFALLSGSKASGGLGWWWHTPHDTLDKIEPAFLVRDTQIYLKLLFQLMNAPILPMDFRLTVKEIQETIETYQEGAGDHLDLSSLSARAAKLRAAVEDLYGRIEFMQKQGDSSSLEDVNQGLLNLARILIPLNYTESARYEHDPASSQPPIPLLKAVNDIGEMTRGSDRYYQTLTTLVRRRNAVNLALRRAVTVANGTVSDFEH